MTSFYFLFRDIFKNRWKKVTWGKKSLCEKNSIYRDIFQKGNENKMSLG